MRPSNQAYRQGLLNDPLGKAMLPSILEDKPYPVYKQNKLSVVLLFLPIKRKYLW